MRTIVAAALPLVLLAAAAYDHRPPPAHTGGFGEPTCAACHFDGPVDDGEGELRLSGLPAGFEPGAPYVLRVVLAREHVEKAGFQLSARTEDARQAGSFLTLDGRTEITEAGGVSYIHQTLEGSVQEHGDSIVWSVRWIAPEERVGVVFHAAGNVANGDASAFGDHVYTHSRALAPE